MDLHSRIFQLLEQAGTPYERITHKPVDSCQYSRLVREEAGWNGFGSKCILFHAKEVFHLVVTHAERALNGRRFKKVFGTKNMRFASPDEVLRVTGAGVGSVPPFCVLDATLPHHVDASLFEAPRFQFNPARPTESVAISGPDLLKVYRLLDNPVQVFQALSDDDYRFFTLAEFMEQSTGPETPAGQA